MNPENMITLPVKLVPGLTAGLPLAANAAIVALNERLGGPSKAVTPATMTWPRSISATGAPLIEFSNFQLVGWCRKQDSNL